MRRILLLSFIAFLLAASVQAQQTIGRLDVKLNKNVFQPGDSLFVKVDYKDGGGQIGNQSLATLELVIENEQGLRTLGCLCCKKCALQRKYIREHQLKASYGHPKLLINEYVPGL